MSEEEIRKLISESLRTGISEIDISDEDQEIDTDEFEDSLGSGIEDYEDEDINLGIEPIPMADVDMPIQDKAYLNLGGDEPYDDEFSDLNGYKEFGDGNDDYEGNWEDDVSVSPGYFNESKIVKVTKEQLQSIIKEGVAKLHKKTLIENRLDAINKELNALNNPQAWEDARTNAQAELAKKTLAWNNITQRERLVSEDNKPKRPMIKKSSDEENKAAADAWYKSHEKPKRPLIKQEKNPVNENGDSERITSEEIYEASNNPYGASMYFLTNYNNILNQDEAMELADNIGDSEYVVKYDINWEGDDMYTESGKQIPSAYGVETETAPEELYEALKAFVRRK